YGIAQGDRRMRQSAGIEHETSVRGEAVLVKVVDQDAFMIGLEVMQVDPGKSLPEMGQVVLERNGAVDLRLAQAEQVEIRAVDDMDDLHGAEDTKRHPPPLRQVDAY